MRNSREARRFVTRHRREGRRLRRRLGAWAVSSMAVTAVLWGEPSRWWERAWQGSFPVYAAEVIVDPPLQRPLPPLVGVDELAAGLEARDEQMRLQRERIVDANDKGRQVEDGLVPGARGAAPARGRLPRPGRMPAGVPAAFGD